MLPNFIIGGTSAGGTSFLSAAMVQHPEIYLPKKMRPEPHYYYKSWEYEKGLNYYQQRWFSEAANQKAVGERSSSYLFSGARVAQRMKQDIPELKLIFTLRNPVQRAWANYRYTALQGLEDTDFDSALKNEQQRIAEQSGIWSEIQPYNYTGRGLYGEQIGAFLDYFPSEQILLIESEQMNKEPQKIFTQAFSFLGVSVDFQPDLPPLHTSVNVHCPKEQQRLREYFGSKFDQLIECIRKDQDPSLHLTSAHDSNAFDKLLSNLDPNPQKMSDWAKDYLQNFYQQDRQRLEQDIGFVPRYW